MMDNYHIRSIFEDEFCKEFILHPEELKYLMDSLRGHRVTMPELIQLLLDGGLEVEYLQEKYLTSAGPKSLLMVIAAQDSLTVDFLDLEARLEKQYAEFEVYLKHRDMSDSSSDMISISPTSSDEGGTILHLGEPKNEVDGEGSGLPGSPPPDTALLAEVSTFPPDFPGAGIVWSASRQCVDETPWSHPRDIPSMIRVIHTGWCTAECVRNPRYDEGDVDLLSGNRTLIEPGGHGLFSPLDWLDVIRDGLGFGPYPFRGDPEYESLLADHESALALHESRSNG
jgi:hypothetical protein